MSDLPSGLGHSGDRPSGMGAGLGGAAALPEEKSTAPSQHFSAASTSGKDDLPSSMGVGLGGAAVLAERVSVAPVAHFSAAPIVSTSGEICSGMGGGLLGAASQATPARSLPSRRTVRIIGDDNGWGLSRDRGIIADVFRDNGWNVQVTSRTDNSAQSSVVVNVHLEIPATSFFWSANRNVIIPNPEWWQSEWSDLLRHPSVSVWAKTADAYRIFRDLGAQITQVGFRSLDRLDEGVPRERAFLHVGGNSPYKGTAQLVASWREEWPRLTVVVSDQLVHAIACPPWVCKMGRVSDEDVRRLQNQHLFHIYPSRYEGFGHAQWEGLSCSATVFIPDAPSFADWPDTFLRIPAEDGAAHAVMHAAAISNGDVHAWRYASRRAWETAVLSFEARAKKEIVTLDDSPKEARLRQGILSGLPPMNYVGRVNCVTGYGAAARHQIWVLRKHGFRLKVVDAGSARDPDPSCEDAFIQEVRRDSPYVDDVRGTIVHLAPNCVEQAHLLGPRPHILVSVWETTRLPQAWVPIVNRFDQVWCATDWQREVYAASGVEAGKLRVVPFAVDPSLYVAEGPTLPEIRRTGRVILGSVFQWTERKNPRALLDAFVRAFCADDPVTLVLKSYEGNDPSTSVEGRVAEIVAGRSHAPIQVISRALTSTEMLAFYRSTNCYVSAHAGEGFGLPIAESLLMGKAVIATNWSAPAEYAAGCFRGVEYGLAAPTWFDWQPFYTQDQQWAHVDVDDLVQAMREAFEGRLKCPVERVRERFETLMAKAGEAARSALEVFR